MTTTMDADFVGETIQYSKYLVLYRYQGGAWRSSGDVLRDTPEAALLHLSEYFIECEKRVVRITFQDAVNGGSDDRRPNTVRLKVRPLGDRLINAVVMLSMIVRECDHTGADDAPCEIRLPVDVLVRLQARLITDTHKTFICTVPMACRFPEFNFFGVSFRKLDQQD